MVVRHHRQHYPAIFGVVLLLLVVTVAGGWELFNYGLKQAGFEKAQLTQRESEWMGIRADLEAKMINQREQIARLEQGYQVDRGAYQHLQDEVARLQDKISSLTDELTFYRDIVSSDSDQKGLLIRAFMIHQMDESNQYHYKIVITKVPNDGYLIRGYLNFVVEGSERGEMKRYSLDQLSLSGRSNDRISFKFKYFQNLSGEMRLPDGFEPTKVMITLNPKGKKLKKSVEQFDWVVEES